MKAGRELDALVAEKVMGLPGVGRYARYSMGTIQWERCDWDASAEFYYEPDAAGSPQWSVPRYSTDIADAWLVVEKLRKTHCCIKVYSDHEYVYECTMIKDPDDPHEGRQGIYGQADTAPLAICLAALAACGVEVPE